jgi:hypothetical protein
MTEADIEIILELAKERYPRVKPPVLLEVLGDELRSLIAHP